MPYTNLDAKREYQRKWVAERRAKFFSDKTCIDCGSNENLELDHIDPAQKVTHRIWSFSWKRINEEVAKCVVRCRECHLAKSKRNLDLGPRKLTVDEVAEIRSLYARGGVSQRELGAMYGVAQRTVSDLLSGTTWAAA